MALDLISIFAMACNPVLNVLVTCAVGTAIAHPYINSFDKNARKSLNKLVFIVFTPALVFSRMATALTLENLFKWWYIPFNVVLCFVIGAGLGYAVVIIAKPPQHLNRLTIASCAAGNAGNLPLVLVPSLCSQKHSPFGSADVCTDNGVSYVSFGMCIAIIVTWTFIYNLLKPSKASLASAMSQGNLANPLGFMPVELHDPSLPIDNIAPTVISAMDAHLPSSTELQLEPLDIGLQPRPTQEGIISSRDIELASTSSKTNDPKERHQSFVQAQSLPSSQTPPPTILMQRISQTTLPQLSSQSALKRIFTPPTTAALMGFIVGAIPPLKDLFFVGPFKLFTDCADLLGGAMIPTMMLILGGNLSEGAAELDMKPLIVGGIVVVRLIALPIIGIFVVQVAASLGFLLPNDKMFHFVLLMQFTVPTAMNIGTVAQLHGFGEKESSIVLFWSYTLSVIALTIWITVYLWLLF